MSAGDRGPVEPALPGGPPSRWPPRRRGGGGKVAQRRLPLLITAGARVEVISPVTTPAVEGHAASGDIVWHQSLRGR
ncbi:MAG: NAD(P)-dependent oxidoreductase [Nocardioidaceae bacterium]